jgi:Holliday junction resolvase-like predicted endonuclease
MMVGGPGRSFGAISMKLKLPYLNALQLPVHTQIAANNDLSEDMEKWMREKMAENTRKMKARDEFIHFAEDLLEQKFGKLNAIQQSYALAKFYVKEIHNRLKTEISDEDLDLSIVDNPNDLGCDIIHRDDNHVLIVQVKYRSEGAREPVESITHFQSLLKRIADPALKANEKFLDRVHSIDWKNDTFSFVFVTFGRIDNQARALSEQPAIYPETLKDIEQRSDWIYLDEQALNEELRSAHSLERGPSEKAHTLSSLSARKVSVGLRLSRSMRGSLSLTSWPSTRDKLLVLTKRSAEIRFSP